MKCASPLTPFQGAAMQMVSDALAVSGRSLDTTQVLSGVVPFFSSRPLTVLKITAGDIEFFLHDDEVGYTSPTRRGGLERAAFESEDELLQAFREILSTLLCQPPRRAD